LEEFAGNVEAENISVEVWFTSPKLRILWISGVRWLDQWS